MTQCIYSSPSLALTKDKTQHYCQRCFYNLLRQIFWGTPLVQKKFNTVSEFIQVQNQDILYNINKCNGNEMCVKFYQRCLYKAKLL